MALLNLSLTFEDGRTENVRIKPIDLDDVMEKFGTEFNADTPRPKHVAYLAWIALTRKGRETRPFDEFFAALDDVDAPDDETPLVPTAETSPPSLSALA